LIDRAQREEAPMSETPDFDEQDGAEALDETNLDDDAAIGGEARTFEELPDVLDVTQAEGDRDEDEAIAADADEFDPELVGDADTEEDHELDYRAATEEHEDDLDGLGPEGVSDEGVSASEIEGVDLTGDADEVEGGEDDFTNFESRAVEDADLENLGYARPDGARKS
jgi:hypothetical protein